VRQTRDKQDNDFVFYNYTFLKDQKGKPSFQIYIPNNTWQPEKFPWLALSVRFIGNYTGKPNLTARLFTSNVPPHVRRQRRNNSGTELDFTDKQANGKYIHGIKEWKAGEWQDILIDVRGFMRDKTKNSSAPMITAAYIYFELEGDQALQVRATAIMGPWAANDNLRFSAYDESGVRGIVWQNGARSDDLVTKPASIKLPPDDNLWLRAQIEDNPGNRSFTYFIPVPPQN
jgi:hypothetical protein